MSKPAWSVAIALWLISLVVVAAMAQARGTTPKKGTVLSGPDLGFRIDSYDGAKLVGALVVRVDGRWIEPKSEVRPRALGSN